MRVGNNYRRSGPSRINRWFTVLAVLLFVLFIAAGIVMSSNYKQLGNLVKVVSLVRSQYIEPVESSTLVDGAIRGMVDALDDPYSVYLDAATYKQLNEQIRGSYDGLGILVGLIDDTLTVARVFEGGPAYAQGIRTGDRIVRIDSREVRNLDLETAVGLMRGPAGSKVNLTVARDGQPEPLQVSLVRKEINLPSVEGEMLADTPGIGYMSIALFHEKTPEEMLGVLDKLQGQGMQGMVLDLRNNPGGELSAAIWVADNFIPPGPLVYIEYGTGKTDVLNADDNYLGLPLVVLINEGSASGAEILAGAIKDTGVGTLLGTKTFGKGIVQTLFPLDNGAGLKLTTARYLTPGKHDIQEKGIIPDLVVENDENAPEEDRQLARAVALLKEKL